MSPLDRRGDAEFRYVKVLGHIHLYLDDIEDIISILQQYSNDVQLWAGAALAEDGAEDLLSARRDELRAVRIVTKRPGVEVRLGYFGARVGTKERTVAARKLVDLVESLMVPRRKAFLATPVEWMLIALTLTLPVPATLYGIAARTYPPGGILTLAAAASVISSIVLSKRIGRAIIVRRWLRERTSQREGMRRDAIVAVITAVIGAAIPGILTGLPKAIHFLQKMW